MLEENLEQAQRPPTLKKGRYVIAGVLGKGGNAGVYQAFDTQLRQWRAIKVLSHQFIKDDEVRARFAQEAATMARLEHENLVRVFDISDDPYTPHIVMELCAANSIIHWMKVHGAVPPRLAVEVIEKTAKGVYVAHQEGMVHRDIKPQNILITQRGQVKLTDFGIAREHDSTMTQAGATIGTYAFMAPEQRHDSTMVDQRADIYSLGATLFTMLQVKTTTELFVAERGDEILEGIPEPLLDVILTACSYKPKNRYDDVPAFLKALNEARKQLPEDPAHPPLEALAMNLPDEPPETLPDFDKLEDLLKSLALHDDTPTYMERPENTTLGSNTTGGSSTGGSSSRALPYAMPSTAPPPNSSETGSRPSYIDESEYEKVAPTPEPEQDSRPEASATPVAAVPVEPVPPYQNPVVLGAASLCILLLAFVGMVFMGAGQVNDAAARTHRADRELLEAVSNSAPVIQATKARTSLEPLYFATQDGDTASRRAAAERYVEELLAASRDSSLKGEQGVLLQHVQAAHERATKAAADWDSAASGPLGAVAVMVGLAPGPGPNPP